MRSINNNNGHLTTKRKATLNTNIIQQSHPQLSSDTMRKITRSNEQFQIPNPLPFTLPIPPISPNTTKMTMTLSNDCSHNSQKSDSTRNKVAISPSESSSAVPQYVTFAVNGFHPQLDFVPNPLEQALSPPSQNTLDLDDKIKDLVNNCREDELKNVAKRQKCSSSVTSSLANDVDLERAELLDMEVSSTCSTDLWTNFFQESSIPQLIANTAGRGVECNAEFLQLCGASLEEPSSSFTILNLVVPSMLPKLFTIFSTALDKETSSPTSSFQTSIQGESSADSSLLSPPSSTEPSCPTANNLSSSTNTHDVNHYDEDDDLVYKCTTLPCIDLPGTNLKHFITIVLMDDMDLEERCFLCIISPACSNSRKLNSQIFPANGEIQCVSHEDILNLM